MNTATILIENLIQGIQTALWMILVACTCIDISPADLKPLQENATFFQSVFFGSIVLAGLYWLGLIVDTAYYHVAIQHHELRWFEQQRKHGQPNLLDMAIHCMISSPDVAALLKERQAHLRMFRVSTVNVGLITVAACLFTVIRVTAHKWLIFTICLIVGIILFGAACYVWRKLYKFYVTLIQTGYGVISLNTSPPVRP